MIECLIEWLDQHLSKISCTQKSPSAASCIGSGVGLLMNLSFQEVEEEEVVEIDPSRPVAVVADGVKYVQIPLMLRFVRAVFPAKNTVVVVVAVATGVAAEASAASVASEAEAEAHLGWRPEEPG